MKGRRESEQNMWVEVSRLLRLKAYLEVLAATHIPSTEQRSVFIQGKLSSSTECAALEGMHMEQ